MGKGSKGQEGSSQEINDEGANGARWAHVYQFLQRDVFILNVQTM